MQPGQRELLNVINNLGLNQLFEQIDRLFG